MKTDETHWSKVKLKVYILMLCAKADTVEAEDEIQLIKAKTSEEIFNKIYQEFQNDNEDESIDTYKNTIS